MRCIAAMAVCLSLVGVACADAPTPNPNPDLVFLQQIQLADSYASNGSLLGNSDFAQSIANDREAYHATGVSAPYRSPTNLDSVMPSQAGNAAAPAENALNSSTNVASEDSLFSGSSAIGNLNLIRAAGVGATGLHALEGVRNNDSLPLSTFLIRAAIVLGALTYVIKLHPSKAERSWDSLANGFFAGWLQ